MDRLSRLEKLQSFFKACGGEITGRKKVQKLVYLCQSLGINLGQEFIFYHYGVYSPGLSNDLRQAENWGILTEEKLGVTYKYKLNEFNDKLSDELIQAKQEIINKLAQKAPATLEVLSTIVYLDSMGYSGVSIRDKLLELKGHLKSFFTEAMEIACNTFGITIPNES